MTSTLALHTTAVLAVGWVLAGAVLAVRLSSQGHGAGLSLAAIVGWPFLVTLALAPPTPVRTRGPLADAIDAAVGGLREAAEDPDAPLLPPSDLDALHADLTRTDLRLARVDALLANAGAATPATAALHTARDEAHARVREAIDELVAIRLQLGLHLLDGDTRPVVARLGALRRRMAAFEETATPGGTA